MERQKLEKMVSMDLKYFLNQPRNKQKLCSSNDLQSKMVPRKSWTLITEYNNSRTF